MPKNRPNPEDDPIEQAGGIPRPDPKNIQPPRPSGPTGSDPRGTPTDPEGQWADPTGKVSDVGAPDPEAPVERPSRHGRKVTGFPANVDPTDIASTLSGFAGGTSRDVTKQRQDEAERVRKYRERNGLYIAYKIWRPPFEFFASDFGTRRDRPREPEEGSTSPTQTESVVAYNRDVMLIAEAIGDDPNDKFEGDWTDLQRALERIDAEKRAAKSAQEVGEYSGTPSVPTVSNARQKELKRRKIVLGRKIESLEAKLSGELDPDEQNSLTREIENLNIQLAEVEDELSNVEHGGGYQFDVGIRQENFPGPTLGPKGELDYSQIAYRDMNPDLMTRLDRQWARSVYSQFIVHDCAIHGGAVELLQSPEDKIVAVEGTSVTGMEQEETDTSKPLHKRRRPRPGKLAAAVQPEAIRKLEAVKETPQEQLDKSFPWGDKTDITNLVRFARAITKDAGPREFARNWEAFRNTPDADRVRELLSRVFIWNWDDPDIMFRDLQAILNPTEFHNRRRMWQQQQAEKELLDTIVPVPQPEEAIGIRGTRNPPIEGSDKRGPAEKYEVTDYDEERGLFILRYESGAREEIPSWIYSPGGEFEHEEGQRGNPWPLRYAENKWQKEQLRKKVDPDSDPAVQAIRDAAARRAKAEKKADAEREADELATELGREGDAVKTFKVSGPEELEDYEDDDIYGSPAEEERKNIGRRVSVSTAENEYDLALAGEHPEEYTRYGEIEDYDAEEGTYTVRFEDGSIEKLDDEEFVFVDPEEEPAEDITPSDFPPLFEAEDTPDFDKMIGGEGTPPKPTPSTPGTSDRLRSMAGKPTGPKRKKYDILMKGGKPQAADRGKEPDPSDIPRTLYYVPETGHPLSDQYGGKEIMLGVDKDMNRVWRVAGTADVRGDDPYGGVILGPATKVDEKGQEVILYPDQTYGMQAVTKNPDWRPKEKAKVDLETGKVTGLPANIARSNTIGKARIREYTTTPRKYSDTGAVATAQGAGGAEEYVGRLHELVEVHGTTVMVTVQRAPDPDLEKELIGLGYPNPRGPYYEVCEAQYIGMKSQDEGFSEEWDPKLLEWISDLREAWNLYNIARRKLMSGRDVNIADRDVMMWKRRQVVKPGESLYYKLPRKRHVRWKGLTPDDKLGRLEWAGLQGREAAHAMLFASEKLLKDTGGDIIETMGKVCADPKASETTKKRAQNVITFVMDVLMADESMAEDEINDLLSSGQRYANDARRQEAIQKQNRINPQTGVGGEPGLVELPWDYDNFRIISLLARLFNIGLTEQGEGVSRWTKRRGYEHDPGRGVFPINSIVKEVSRPSFSGVSAQSPSKTGQPSKKAGRRVGYGTYGTKGRDTRYYPPGRGPEESVDRREAIIEALEHSVQLKNGEKAAKAFAALARASAVTENAMVLLCGFKGDEKVLNGLTARVVECNDEEIVVNIVDTPRASIIHEDDRRIVVKHDEAIVIRK